MKSHRPHPDLEPGPPGPLPLLHSRGDVPAAVRDALDAGRAELPSAAVLARLAAKLPPPGPPGGSGSAPREGGKWASGARPAAAVSGAAPSLLPGVVVGALLGVAASAVLALWAPPPSGMDGSAAAVVTPVAAEDRKGGVGPAPAAGDGAARGSAEDENAQAVSGPVERPTGGGSWNGSGAGRAASSATATLEPPAPQPDGAAAAGSAAGPSASPTASAEAPAESESALLQRAQRALGSSPAAALAITGEHVARYPGGMLAQEREVIAISALVAMGRAGEARSRAAAFLGAHPRSAHRPRIEALVPGVKE
jgi:hypothetical protein